MAGARPGRHGGGWMMPWGGPGFLWMILIAAFWIVVIAGLILLIRRLTASPDYKGRAGQGSDSALEILRKRYAKGEIDREEFEQKKKDLEERN